MAEAPDYSGYAFVSIGANLPSVFGDPAETVDAAFDQIATLSSEESLRSSVYITSPVGSPEGTPDFYNAVTGIIPLPEDTPVSLLHKLLAIENDAGRVRTGTINEARTLDLDLITFRDEILASEELILPHPRAHLRRFVLEPLIEIAGTNFFLPGLDKCLQVQLDEVSDLQLIRKN